MLEKLYRTLKFHFLHLKICWLRVQYESEYKCKPDRLHLAADVFDHMYVYIIKYGFQGDCNFDNIFEEVFGVASLSRSNGIKFARYE